MRRDPAVRRIDDQRRPAVRRDLQPARVHPVLVVRPVDVDLGARRRGDRASGRWRARSCELGGLLVVEDRPSRRPCRDAASGVLVASFQTPCRSGSPHGVCAASSRPFGLRLPWPRASACRGRASAWCRGACLRPLRRQSRSQRRRQRDGRQKSTVHVMPPCRHCSPRNFPYSSSSVNGTHLYSSS